MPPVKTSSLLNMKVVTRTLTCIKKDSDKHMQMHKLPKAFSVRIHIEQLKEYEDWQNK